MSIWRVLFGPREEGDAADAEREEALAARVRELV